MEATMKHLFRKLADNFRDEFFLERLHFFEKLVAKILTICLVVIVFVSLFDLIKILIVEFANEPFGFFNKSLIELFGLILNILISLELLENLTGYLKKNVIQVELVIVTAIIALARKVIIFDFTKYGGIELISLGFAILCLAVSYCLLKRFSR
jgi:uncharacterized membrane protein (DUF373 family)